MAIRAMLKRNTYYDSITLMSVAQTVKDLPGVEDVGVVMATELNRELLHNSNLLPVAFLAKQETTPGPEDLLIVVRAIDEAHAEAALTVAEKRLTSPGDRGDSGAPVGIRAGTLVEPYLEGRSAGSLEIALRRDETAKSCGDNRSRRTCLARSRAGAAPRTACLPLQRQRTHCVRAAAQGSDTQERATDDGTRLRHCHY